MGAKELTLASTPPIIDQDRVDRIIWRTMGVKSAREVAKETGLDPAEVLRRRNELLDGVDDLTIKQAKQKLIADLGDIASRAQDDYENAPWEFKSGIFNSAIAASKAVLVELNRADKADTEKINHLNQLRIRELVDLMQEIVDVSVEQVALQYDLDADELFAIFNANLAAASKRREAIA
jgi:hypothetical protein